MWEWSKLGTDYSHMLDYMTLPALKVGEKITPQNEHSNGYHTLCVLHLHGHDTKIREEFASVNDRLFIAPHHFKPCLRAALARSTQEKSNLKKYRCSMQEAKDALLTAADVCKIRGKGDTDPKVYYYLAPNNNNFDDIKHELAEAKAKARMELDAVNTSSKKKKLGSDTTSAPLTSRQVDSTSPTTTSSIKKKPRAKYNQPVARTRKRSPMERDFDNMCQMFKENPAKYVLERKELKQQVAELEKELKDVKAANSKEIAELRRENEELRKEIEK